MFQGLVRGGCPCRDKFQLELPKHVSRKPSVHWAPLSTGQHVSWIQLISQCEVWSAKAQCSSQVMFTTLRSRFPALLGPCGLSFGEVSSSPSRHGAKAWICVAVSCVALVALGDGFACSVGLLRVALDLRQSGHRESQGACFVHTSLARTNGGSAAPAQRQHRTPAVALLVACQTAMPTKSGGGCTARPQDRIRRQGPVGPCGHNLNSKRKT